MLTKVEWFAYKDDDNRYMSQFQWTFTDMFPAVGTTPAAVVTTQGTLPHTDYALRGSLTLTEKVTKIQVCCDYSSDKFYGKDLKFYYASGSATINGWQNCDHTMTLVNNPFVGAIRGFHWRRSNLDRYYDDARYWSVFLDDDPCSMATIPALTATNMQIIIGNGSSATQDLSSQKQNTVGSSCVTGSGYVFAAYNSPAYSWLTVTPDGLITVSPTSDPADAGSHLVTVVLDLYPYTRAKVTFTVTIIDPNAKVYIEAKHIASGGHNFGSTCTYTNTTSGITSVVDYNDKTTAPDSYMLTKVEWYAHSDDDRWMSQFKWTFTDMFPAVGTTPATVVTTQGTLPDSNYALRGSLTFTQKITKIDAGCDFTDSSDLFRGNDLKFYYASGSATINGWYNIDHTMTLVVNPFVGAIRGFHWRRAYSSAFSKYYDDARYWSVFLDNDPCSMATTVLTATNMSIENDGIQTATQDLSSQKTNSIGSSCAPSSGYVFAAYNSPAFSWLTVSADGLITVGPTLNVADCGIHTVNVIMDLYPYARAKASFTVTISCFFDAPQSATTTFTYKIPSGGLTTPVNIFSFTQTTASQNCSITALSTFVITKVSGNGSLTTAKCYPTSNTTTGGNVTLNSLTTSNNLGTFSVKIQNKNAANVIKEFTFTLIIDQWTCIDAVFETSPSPFSDIMINMPTTNYNVPFKVYTDLERTIGLVCPIIATFTTSYAAVSVASSYSNINVTPSSILIPSEYGAHPVQVEIKSAGYDQANVARVYFNFNVIVRCSITSFAISTTQTDFHFELESGTPTPKGPYNAVQTPNCQYAVTYRVDWYIDNILQGSPGDASGQFDLAQQKYTAITNYSHPDFVGKVIKYNLVYSITDVFGTGHTAEKALLMTIDPNCKVSVLQDRTWSTLIIKVPAPGYPQSSFIDASLLDTTATFFNSPSKCGDRLLSAWNPALPSYVSYDGATQKLSTNAIAATLADVGAQQSYSVRCDIKDFIGFATGFTKTNVVIQVICEVFAIQWNTTPPGIIEVVPGITTQPVLVPFASTALPACVDTVYTIAFPPSFVFLDSITQIPTPGGNVKIDGALATNHNDYPLVLTATTGTIESTQNFIVRIADPCSKQVFDSSTLSDMTIIRNFDPAKIQIFSVSYSTLGSNPPFVCPFSCSITNPAGGRPFIIQDAGDQFKITADPALITSSDVGDNLSDITCSSVNFPSLVAPKVFQFNTIVSECQVNTMGFLLTNPGLSHVINAAPLTGFFQPVQWSDLACQYHVTYLYSLAKQNVGQVAWPSWINANSNALSLTYSPTLPSAVGFYTLTITAQIPQPSVSAGIKEATTSFQLEVIHDCVNTELQTTAIPHVVHRIATATSNQSFWAEDSKAIGQNNKLYCGNRNYVLSPSHSFLTVSGDAIHLYSVDPADEGEYVVTVTISLVDFPLVPPIHVQFKAIIECEIFSIDVITELPPFTPYQIVIDPPLFMPFKVSESPKCGLNYAVSPTKNFAFYNATVGQVEVSSKNFNDEGEYDFKLIASPPRFGVSAELTFSVKMVNLCGKANIIPQKIPNMFAFKQDPSFVAQTSFEFQDFTYDMWMIYHADCGPVNYKLVMNASNKPVPSFVTLKDKKVDVNFNQMPGPATINLGLFAYLKDLPIRNVTIPFTIELSSSELQCLQTTNQKYKFGDPPLNFAVNYQNTTINTGIVLTAVKTPLAIDSRGGEADLPSFVKYDSATGFFTVKQPGFADFSNYKIGIKIGYKEFPTFSLTCTTPLTIGYDPTFTETGGEMLKSHDINCGQSWSTIIPEFKDAFGYKVEPVVDLGKLEDYLLYISGARNITTAEDVKNIPTGDYEIKINLVDQLGYAAQKKFKIHAICLSFLNGAQAASEKYTVRPPKGQVQNNPPKPFIKSINNVGQVRVGFTQKIQIPTYTKFPEFREDKNRMKQNCTLSYANPDQCYTRLLLKQSIQEQTQEAVEIVNRGLVFNEEKVVWEPVIDLQMEPGYYSTRADLDFVWNCTDFQPTYIDFQINYNNFMNVSIHDFKDSLKVQFNGYWYFQSAENNEIIEESVAIIEKAVPLQMDPRGSASLQQAVSTVKAASKSIVIANFAINLFLGGALQQLFSAIRKLTIMVHLLIINVSIPANAQVFFAGLLSFVTFDIIELGPYIRSGLNLPDEPVLINENFGYLGYSSGYFVINMGSLVIAMVYYVLMLFFYVVTMCVKNEKFNRFRNWLTKGLIWNSIISFIVESYMLFSISTFTNFKKLEFNSVGTILSSNLAMLGFVILVGYPLWSLFFMRTQANKLHTPNVKNKFGVVYEGLQLKRGRKGPMTEPLVNLYRMLLLTIVLIYLQKYRYFQLFFVNMSVTFIVIYVGWCEPYIEKKTLNFQFFNESFIAIMIYHLMCFADFILDEPTRNIMGWSMIICVCFNLAINIGFIMIDVGKDTYKSLKKKYLLYKLKKAKLLAEARQVEKQIKLQEDIEKHARLQLEGGNQPGILNGGNHIDKNELRGKIEAKFKVNSNYSCSFENSLSDMQLLAAEIDAQFDKPSKQYLELHGILENARGRALRASAEENKFGKAEQNEEWPSESSEQEKVPDKSYDEKEGVEEAPDKLRQQSLLQSFVSYTDEYEQQQIMRDIELRYDDAIIIPKIGDDLRMIQELREQERKQKDDADNLQTQYKIESSASKFILSHQEEDKNNFGQIIAKTVSGESQFGLPKLRKDNYFGQSKNSLGRPRKELVGSDASLSRMYLQRISDDALEQEQRVLQRRNEINAMILQPSKTRQMFENLWRHKTLNENERGSNAH